MTSSSESIVGEEGERCSETGVLGVCSREASIFRDLKDWEKDASETLSEAFLLPS